MSRAVCRQASKSDIPDLARIHLAGWRAAYGGIVDQAYLDGLCIEDRKQKWAEWMDAAETDTLIADMNGAAAGFVTYGRLRTAPPGTSSVRPLYTAEIFALYVLPEFWRQGAGATLMREAGSRLKEDRRRSLCLWVLDKNERGKTFYDKLGGQRIGKKMIEIGPTRAREICYGWRDLSPILKAGAA